MTGGFLFCLGGLSRMTREWIELGHQWLNAFGTLWVHPFYWLSLLLLFYQYTRQVHFERRAFGIRLHSAIQETLSTFIWGAIAGVIVSVLFIGLGVVLRPTDLFWVWGVALLLSLIRVRYLCLAYAVGVVGIFQMIVRAMPNGEWKESPLVDSLLQTNLPSLLAIVGILHLAEAFLVAKQGSRAAMPMFYESKRGKVVGGYELQRFWPLPLMLWIPMTGDATVLPYGDALASWGWPWLSSAVSLASLQLFFFPTVVGYGDRTTTEYPEKLAKSSAQWLVGYGFMMIGVSIGVKFYPMAAMAGAILSFVLHELMIWMMKRRESGREPMYIHSNHGLKVLAVLPGSPAEAMAIQPGEIIHKVNGMKVKTKEELHQAIQLNPAFCRMELFNRSHELRLTHRSLYNGEHHQLGILLCPDHHARYAVKLEPSRWFGYGKNPKQTDPPVPEQPQLPSM
jgi:hypothetical protein